jgi:hypothetical protein
MFLNDTPLVRQYAPFTCWLHAKRNQWETQRLTVVVCLRCMFTIPDAWGKASMIHLRPVSNDCVLYKTE